MVKIKLSRVGKKHEPHFRIVVTQQRSKIDGQYIENLGTYNPISKIFTLDQVAYDAWIKKGAQPTETVSGIVKKYAKV